MFIENAAGGKDAVNDNDSCVANERELKIAEDIAEDS